MTDSLPTKSRQPVTAEKRYHVPRSQVWEGSRGRQVGKVHLHVTEPLFSPPLVRSAGKSLCGRVGWYERPLDGDRYEMCPTCVKRAERYGVIFDA